MDEFMYDYTVIELGTDQEVARYESNAAPPIVGSIFDFETAKMTGLSTLFKILSVHVHPISSRYKVNSPTTRVMLYVRATQPEDTV